MAAQPKPIIRSEIMSGWKEIANYLGKGIRTMQRYERELGLPVHRPRGKPVGSVMATKAELQAWIEARPIRQGFRLAQPRDLSDLFDRLSQNIAEGRRLRQQSAELLTELQARFEMLRTNLWSAMPRSVDELPSLHHWSQTVSPRRRMANVLILDPLERLKA